MFAKCWIGTDASQMDVRELARILRELERLPGSCGYFTDVFCIQSRFFQPKNGERIDAIRNYIEHHFLGSPWYPILLTTLILAADRVDSTTGVQMAYLKGWAPRAFNDLEMRLPELLPGPGRAVRGDASLITSSLGSFDLAYLDPPYNQHRYFTNYHIFETLVAWDSPEHYGVACKRLDSREEDTKSVFNNRREMPGALSKTIHAVDAEIVIVSYNNEAWVSLKDLQGMCSVHGYVETLAFDSKRYVGAQIGIFNPDGEKVGSVSHLRNLEYVFVCGPEKRVRLITAPYVNSQTVPTPPPRGQLSLL
jgi:adenine-specific DNA-methyltransferase